MKNRVVSEKLKVESLVSKQIQKAIAEKDLPSWRPQPSRNHYWRFCKVCKRWNCMPIRFV
jgi:hypothetical protein